MLWQRVIQAEAPWIGARAARVLLGVNDAALEQLHGKGLLEARYDKKGVLQYSRADILAIAGQTGQLPRAWGGMSRSLRREVRWARVRGLVLSTWLRGRTSLQEARHARKLARARKTHMTEERKAQLEQQMLRRGAALDDLKTWFAKRWSTLASAPLRNLKERVADRWQVHRVAKARRTHMTVDQAANALVAAAGLPSGRQPADVVNPLVEAGLLRMAAHEVPRGMRLRYRGEEVASAAVFLAKSGRKHPRLRGLFREPTSLPRRASASSPARRRAGSGH